MKKQMTAVAPTLPPTIAPRLLFWTCGVEFPVGDAVELEDKAPVLNRTFVVVDGELVSCELITVDWEKAVDVDAAVVVVDGTAEVEAAGDAELLCVVAGADDAVVGSASKWSVLAVGPQAM